MRATLFVAPLVLATVTLAAPYTPWPGRPLNPETQPYDLNYSYRNMVARIADNSGPILEVATREFHDKCMEFKPDAQWNVTAKSVYPGAGKNRVEAYCGTSDEQNRVLTDFTFRIAYNLSWTPLLANAVADRVENHIYKFPEGVKNDVGKWTEACEKAFYGNANIKPPYSDGTAIESRTYYCSHYDLDISGMVAEWLGWVRWDLSEPEPHVQPRPPINN